MTGLVIQNIRLTNCSSTRVNLFRFHDWNYYERSKMRNYKKVTGSLTLGNTYETLLHNVHITESSGYGLFCYNLLGAIKLKNCHFHNNSANAQIDRRGGNILIVYQYLMNTEDCVVEITHNKIISGRNFGGSGGLELEGTDIKANYSLQITSCEFYNNTGADLSIRNTWRITFYQINIKNSYFHDPTSLKYDSAFIISEYLQLKEMQFTIINSTFEGNSAKESGGAIKIYGPAYQPERVNFTIIKCSFSNNIARREGGAVAVRHVTLNAIECKFRNNTAINSGGHISISGDFLMSLVDCVFENGSSLTGEGGGTYLYPYDFFKAQVLNCTFQHNKADRGAGLAADFSKFSVGDSLQGLLRLKYCNFIENYANHSGGMHILSDTTTAITVHIEHCKFIRNTAMKSAGGLEVLNTYHRTMMTVEIIYTEFVGNAANEEGSAIKVSECEDLIICLIHLYQ